MAEDASDNASPDEILAAARQASERRLTLLPSLLHSSVHAAGWSSQVARRAHNPKVAGSNPAPAIRKPCIRRAFGCLGAAVVPFVAPV